MSRRKKKRRTKLFGVLARIIHVVLIISAMILGLFLVGGYFFGENMPLIGIFFMFPMLIFLAASVLLALLFAGSGLRWWLILPLAEIGSCIFMLQPRMNSFVPVPDDKDPITVMSYNVKIFGEGVDGVKDIVRKIGPDILFIQEYRYAEIAPEEFQKELFPDGSFILSKQNAVFSKYQLKDEEWLDVHYNRSIQKTVVTIGNSEIELYNVHMPVAVRLNFHNMTGRLYRDMIEKQKTGREVLLEAIRVRKRPMIVAGDFNAAQHSLTIRKLQQKLEDSFLKRGIGLGHTFNAKYPAIRIDYAFFSSEFTIYSHEVLDERASDHRPIVVKVSLE